MLSESKLNLSSVLLYVCLSLCLGSVVSQPVVARDFDVSGKSILAFTKFGTNDKYLFPAKAPDSLWQGALALQASGGIGDLRFFSETVVSFEEFHPSLQSSNSDVRLNEAYLTWNGEELMLIVGRKRTRWGTGLVASPTDIISTAASPLAPNDDFFQITGRDLVQLSYTDISSSFDLLFIGAKHKARQLEKRAVAMRYYTNIGSLDISLLGGLEENRKYVVGGNMALTIGQSLELHTDILYDSDAQSRQPVISTLGQLSFGRSSQVSALVGMNWTTPNDINVILEYLYFEDGLKNNQIKNLINAKLTQPTSLTDDLSLQQTHYLFGFLTKDDVLDTLDVEYSFLKSLENNGYYHSLRVTHDLSQNSSLFAEVRDTGGSRTTEFGQYPVGISLQLGLKASF